VCPTILFQDSREARSAALTVERELRGDVATPLQVNPAVVVGAASCGARRSATS
jgi:hypothetical protein